jgi:periplasmic divalent cation tolerance protein
MMTKTGYLLIMTTTDKKTAAEEIASALVERRLAACVQVVGPIISTYWWQGKIERAEEWQCQIKSRTDRYTDIEKTIRSLHSYEVPEIVAVPITGGSGDYLQWMDDNTGPWGL